MHLHEFTGDCMKSKREKSANALGDHLKNVKKTGSKNACKSPLCKIITRPDQSAPHPGLQWQGKRFHNVIKC